MIELILIICDLNGCICGLCILVRHPAVERHLAPVKVKADFEEVCVQDALKVVLLHCLQLGQNFLVFRLLLVHVELNHETALTLS